MSLEKTQQIDQLTVDQFGTIFVRQSTTISENGKEISKTYLRTSYPVESDLSAADPKVQAMAQAMWTPEAIAAYKAEEAKLSKVPQGVPA
jgi:hypothetical protein